MASGWLECIMCGYWVESISVVRMYNVWLVGVTVRRYIDILIINITFPTPLVLALFLAAASLLCLF